MTPPRRPITRVLLASLALGGVASAPAQLLRHAPATLALPADLPAATGYTLENALGTLTFSEPLAIAAPPGETGRVFIVEKTGTIQVVNLTGGAPTKSTFLDVRAISGVGSGTTTNFMSDGESGLLGLAFHPAYATNRTFFIFYTVRVGGNRHQRVARLTASASNSQLADPASHAPLITQRDEQNNHNGGDLHFGPDGYLYVATGDEGGGNDSLDNSRWIDRDFHSAILRLDVDRTNVGQPGGSVEPNPHPAINLDPANANRARYAVPPDNPLLVTDYAGTLGPLGAGAFGGGNLVASKLRTEFAVFGLRNPWRISFDHPTGRLFIADVGQGAREEISIAPLGSNLGWPYLEGTVNGPASRLPAPANPPVPRLAPIHEYPRTVGSSITGGVVYRGGRLPELFAHYLFADYGSSRVFALQETNGTWTRRTLINSGAPIVGIGFDPRNGDALFANIWSGVVGRLARSGTTGTAPPATLSATGAFANLATLAPAVGVVPYDINLPFWSDHAAKRRWFALPGDPTAPAITFAADTPWTFPTGTVWVKHFDLPTARGASPSALTRRIETRFLVKTTAGSYGLSYRWREDQTDADLVAEAGADVDYPVNVNGIDQTQRWRFPGRGECLACHTPAAGHALSFHTRQLHRPGTYGTSTANQILHLADAGYLSTASAPTPEELVALPAHAALTDASQSLEHRVRSYLAVNCISCHVPGGAGLGGFDVTAALSTEATRLRTATLVNNGGDPANRLLAPGDAAHSMLLKRILGDGAPRMPPLATNELDPDAEQLLRDYIAELVVRPTFEEWQAAEFADPAAPEAAPEADADGDGLNNRFEYLADTSPTTAGVDPLALTLAQTSVGEGSSEGPGAATLSLGFTHPAGREAWIETSTDLTEWTRWAVPENGALWPATDTARAFAVPLDAERQFFRVRLRER